MSSRLDALPLISPRSPREKPTVFQAPPSPEVVEADKVNNGTSTKQNILSRENSMKGFLPPVSPVCVMPGSVRRLSNPGLEITTTLFDTTSNSFRQTPPVDANMNRTNGDDGNTKVISISAKEALESGEESFAFPPQPAESESASPANNNPSLSNKAAAVSTPDISTKRLSSNNGGSSTPIISSIYSQRHSRVESGGAAASAVSSNPGIQTSSGLVDSFAQAIASKDGTLLSVNEKFSKLCESICSNMEGRNIIDLAAFESPDEMMLASCTISGLTGADTWTCALRVNPKYNVNVSVNSTTPTAVAGNGPSPTAEGTTKGERGSKNRNKRNKEALKVILMPIETPTFVFPRRDTNLSIPQLQVFSSRAPSEAVAVGTPVSGVGVTGAQQLEQPQEQQQQHILVIDDSRTVTNIISHVLKLEGFKVTTENTGQGGLERLKASPWCGYYYAVLVDINMPSVDGLQLCHDFRELEPQLPQPQLQQPPPLTLPVDQQEPSTMIPEGESYVPAPVCRQVLIGMTGDFSATIVHEVMAAGFDGFLPKPFSVKKLREVINGLGVD